MKKLFKKETVENKSMEKTMDEVTSKIMEEHLAAVENFKEIDKDYEEKLSREYVAEAEEIIEDINNLLDKARLKTAYNKGKMVGMIQGGVAALGGVAIGLVYVSSKLK